MKQLCAPDTASTAVVSPPSSELSERPCPDERGAVFFTRQGYVLKETVLVSARRRGKPRDPRVPVTRRLVSW